MIEISYYISAFLSSENVKQGKYQQGVTVLAPEKKNQGKYQRRVLIDDVCQAQFSLYPAVMLRFSAVKVMSHSVSPFTAGLSVRG